MNSIDKHKTINIQVVPFTIADAIQAFTPDKSAFRCTIMHGCNCLKVMGSGVAKWIRETFPAAYKVDCDSDLGFEERLGKYTKVLETFETPEIQNILIYNLYTQLGVREFNNRTFQYTKPFSLSAFGDAFRAALYDLYDTKLTINSTAIWPFNYPIFLPCIGAGLGGGDWLEIQTELLKSALDVSRTRNITLPTIFVCIPI